MAQAKGTHRVTVTVNDDTLKQMQYYANKKNISINQFLNDAIDTAIAWENKDYPIPTLEQARLNQLIDQMAIMSSNMSSLEKVVTSGFDSLLGLTRGDNYLLEHEDGEL